VRVLTSCALSKAVSRWPRFDPRSVHGVHSDTGTGVSVSIPVFPRQYRSAASSSALALYEPLSKTNRSAEFGGEADK
jgi:hypothetical protein